MVGNTVKGMINADYEVTIEVLIEAYFKIIARRNIMFIRSQIAS
jgi:hypothetical protein